LNTEKQRREFIGIMPVLFGSVKNNDRTRQLVAGGEDKKRWGPGRQGDGKNCRIDRSVEPYGALMFVDEPVHL
jgi:hypothetical protein